MEAFIRWHTDQLGRISTTDHMTLNDLQILARHYLREPTLADALRTLKRALPKPAAVRDKRQRWLLPEDLEAIGCARYPAYARMLRDGKTGDWNLFRAGLQLTALWVEISLIIRFLVRHPIRMRNIVEMELDKHLRRLPNGTWELSFRGDDLKVARRKGRENHLTFTWPCDLQPLLEEWLDHWRPELLRNPASPRRPSMLRGPWQPRISNPKDRHVFLTSTGVLFKVGELYYLIMRTTYKFGGVAVNPHMFRDIFATTYIKATRDIIGAAYMLGDDVATTLQHYAHLLEADAETRAIEWLNTRLRSDR